jgi:hypothetical protein
VMLATGMGANFHSMDRGGRACNTTHASNKSLRQMASGASLMKRPISLGPEPLRRPLALRARSQVCDAELSGHRFSEQKVSSRTRRTWLAGPSR